MVRRLERARATDLTVRQLTLTELHQELQRRVDDLHRKRQELEDQIAAIDRELETIGAGSEGKSGNGRGGSRGGPGTRKRNAVPLADCLVEVLQEHALTTREAAESVLTAGYSTSSKSFGNVVNMALNRDDRFERKDGKWSLVASALEVKGETETPAPIDD